MASKEIIEVKKSDKGLLRELPEKERPQFIKTPEGLLRQTIGRVDQLDLFEKEKEKDNIKRVIEKHEITGLGMRLSVPERYLVHALQTLVDNPKNIKEESKDFITLSIDVSTFYNAYGVNKYLQKGKYEKLDSKDIERAITTLDHFADKKPFLFYLSEKESNGNYKGSSYKVNMIAQRIFHYRDLKEGEDEKLIEGGINLKTLTHIELIISKWFMGISYVLIPQNIFTKIKKSFNKPNKHFLEFVSWLYIKANHREFKPFIYKHSLIKILNLERLSKQYRQTRLNNYLANIFKMAKDIGLIEDYSSEHTSIGEKITFILNIKDNELYDIKQPKTKSITPPSPLAIN